ncbi:TOMM system kinase/cyclase fusion protein [compost metagenome]
MSHGKAFAYFPLIELLNNYFQITALDDERRCREKVMGKALTLERGFEELVPYLLYLLVIGERSSALAEMDPQIQHDRIFDAITQLLVRESRDQPIELLFEDLQWLDRETEAFLARLIDRVASAPILLLVNYRPEYQPVWTRAGHCSQLRLEPLGPAEAQGLLAALLGDDPTLVPLKQLILEKTEGNPFFMEEVVQTLVEEKSLLGEPGRYRIQQTPAALHIPTTVQGVLAARIDRLPVAEKELLQTLAVIGKEFAFSLIQRICDGRVARMDDDLHDLLARLEAAEFIYQRPAFPEVEYSFKHALTQEVAGHSLLMERRSALHERTAQAIEAMFPTRIADYCSELAHHYRLSGNVPKAVEYLQCTGQQALQHSAHLDAMRHLGTALEMLEQLPDTPARVHQELTLLLSLGPALMAGRDYGAPEVAATYTRALALCAQVGDDSALFPALQGLRTYYSLRAEYSTACDLAERLLSVAQTAQDPDLLVEAHGALGATLFFQGDLRNAHEHQERARVLYNPDRHRTHAITYGMDPGYALTFSALSLWYLGFPDQASTRSRDSLAVAKKISHPFNLVFTLSATSILRQFRQDVRLAEEYADAVIKLSLERGFSFYLAWGTVIQGWARAEQGNIEQGIAQITKGIATYQATGAELGCSYFLALLAAVHGRVGQPQAGLDAVTDALAMVNRTGEHFYEAELYRLKGTLTLQCPGEDRQDSSVQQEAQACFQKAISVARQQGAKSLELRATMSLAQLWETRDKEAARQMLADIYSFFTEGFDSVDLLQAKALLDAWAPSGG